MSRRVGVCGRHSSEGSLVPGLTPLTQALFLYPLWKPVICEHNQRPRDNKGSHYSSKQGPFWLLESCTSSDPVRGSLTVRQRSHESTSLYLLCLPVGTQTSQSTYLIVYLRVVSHTQITWLGNSLNLYMNTNLYVRFHMLRTGRAHTGRWTPKNLLTASLTSSEVHLAWWYQHHLPHSSSGPCSSPSPRFLNAWLSAIRLLHFVSLHVLAGHGKKSFFLPQVPERWCQVLLIGFYLSPLPYLIHKISFMFLTLECQQGVAVFILPPTIWWLETPTWVSFKQQLNICTFSFVSTWARRKSRNFCQFSKYFSVSRCWFLRGGISVFSMKLSPQHFTFSYTALGPGPGMVSVSF